MVVDIGLPDMSGLDVGREILERFPDIRVVAVTALNDVDVMREAMRIGFSGFLTKNTSVVELVASLRSVNNGEVVVTGRMAQRTREGRIPDDEDAALLARQLTPRELEVLALLAEGASSESIARRLSVSANTVRTHIQNVLTKLQVHSRLEAAAFAVRHGIVKPPSTPPP